MKEKFYETLYSKELKYVLIAFAIIMTITNPGKLEISDPTSELGLPSVDKYFNCILFSCGDEFGTYEKYEKTPNGALDYIVVSFSNKYIGIFYNYFIVSENMKTHEKKFNFMSKL